MTPAGAPAAGAGLHNLADPAIVAAQQDPRALQQQVFLLQQQALLQQQQQQALLRSVTTVHVNAYHAT